MVPKAAGAVEVGWAAVLGGALAPVDVALLELHAATSTATAPAASASLIRDMSLLLIRRRSFPEQRGKQFLVVAKRRAHPGSHVVHDSTKLGGGNVPSLAAT
jgi:hypothetical protein